MLDNKYKVIGLSGVAGSGKDLFCELLLNSYPNTKRYSLADSLKSELRGNILKNTGIDILNCSREQKDTVRPLLVNYAKEKRESSQGRHWLRRLNQKMLPLQENVCITDIRYDDYDHDEVYWLKHELGGVLVHISRYEIINNNKKFCEAPNEEERRNNPKLIAKADYVIQWPTFDGSESEVKARVKLEVDKFLGWLSDDRETKRQSTNLES